jgi:KaiC/GvpD/RAD55 family RecA-like ATPase
MDGPGPVRTAYLDYVARCRQVFTPFAPIELPEFFAGRKETIDDIHGELQAPGRQVAVYGERGVGKTSLALLLYFFAGYDDEQVHIFRCHDGVTFDDIWRALLTNAGHLFGVNGAQAESAHSGEGRLGPVGGSLSRRTTVSFRAVRDARAITPGRILETFQRVRKLLIIDEFDRVQDAQTKTRMAELIKHFSDARSETKIVVVGVAETLNELIGQHESLSRSLAQIGLKHMAEPELADIIERGSQRTSAKFDSSVALRIVRLADGFPHFVHLLSLYASLYAGECLHAAPPGSPHVGDREYHLGLKSAIGKSEHSLQEAYESAVITTRRKSDIYELTLRAMALSEARDVQVRELAKHASYLARSELRPEKFSNALGELVKEERSRILTKVRDGYYKYTNPLMRAYIRLLLEFDNRTQHGGQLEFQYMRGA